MALLAGGAHSMLGSRSAAFIYGLIDDRPSLVTVCVPDGKRSGTSRSVPISRIVGLDGRDRRTAKGFPVTCPARTLVDLAAVLPDRQLAAAVDSALLRGLVTIAVVRRYIRERRLQRKRGVGRLLRLLDDREFGVPESELERRALELIARYRLPAPARQQRVESHRVDLMYPHQRVVIELDGRATHGTAEAFEADPVRQNALELRGWTVLRFTWKHITQDPDYVAETTRRAVVRELPAATRGAP